MLHTTLIQGHVRSVAVDNNNNNDITVLLKHLTQEVSKCYNLNCDLNCNN